MQVVVMLASELVSNAVQHANAESIPIRFEVLRTHVRVDVADAGAGFIPNPRRPEHGRTGGWGLHLVDELASRWGVSDTVDGTRVWFEIDR